MDDNLRFLIRSNRWYIRMNIIDRQVRQEQRGKRTGSILQPATCPRTLDTSKQSWESSIGCNPTRLLSVRIEKAVTRSTKYAVSRFAYAGLNPITELIGFGSLLADRRIHPKESSETPLERTRSPLFHGGYPTITGQAIENDNHSTHGQTQPRRRGAVRRTRREVTRRRFSSPQHRSATSRPDIKPSSASRRLSMDRGVANQLIPTLINRGSEEIRYDAHTLVDRFSRRFRSMHLIIPSRPGLN